MSYKDLQMAQSHNQYSKEAAEKSNFRWTKQKGI